MKRTCIRVVFLLTGLLTIISCKPDKKKFMEAEKAAVDSVVVFYGGCQYNLKKKQNFLGPADESFSLELVFKDCRIFPSFGENEMDILASGMAYRIYSRLDGSNTKYAMFSIAFDLPSGLVQFDFKKNQLQEVEKNMITVDQSVAEIRTRRYGDLYNRCEKNDTNFRLIPLENVKKMCEFIDSSIGSITDYWFVGFRKVELETVEGQFLQLITSLIGTKSPGTLRLTIHPLTGKIVGIRFD